MTDVNEEIQFLITNLEFTGTEYTRELGTAKLDKFTLEISSYKIVFKQLEDYEERIKQLKKDKENSGEFTTKIIVKTLLDNYEEVKSIVDNLCWLLSFAKGVDVIASQGAKFKNGKKIWSQANSVGARPFKRDFVITELPPEDLVNFLIETYPSFVKYKEAFGLTTLFNLYTSMKSAFYMEIRCITGYVLLETLGNNMQEYYKDILKNPIKNSLKWTIEDLKKILPSNHNLQDDDIQKIIDKISYPNPTLQDIIKIIKRDFKFKFKSEELKLLEYRKYFIHKGKFPPEVSNIKIYNDLINFIDRILLSILKYTGEYCDVTNMYCPKTMEYES